MIERFQTINNYRKFHLTTCPVFGVHYNSTLVGMSVDGDSVVVSISNVKSIKVKSKMTSAQKTVFGMGIAIMGLFLYVVYLFRDFHI